MKIISLISKVSLLLMCTTLFVAACSKAPATPIIDATQGIQMLAGEYTMDITQEDIDSAGLIDTGFEGNLGVWHIILSDDGSFEATLDGKFIARGDYEVTGDKIKIGIGQVCSDCDCPGNIGRYHWSLEGNELRFAKISDSCDRMVIVLTSRTLVRVP